MSGAMRILVTGGYGLIGSACLARLHNAGHDLVATGRSLAGARRSFPYAQWIEAEFTRLNDARAWLPLIAGSDAVVNCVGVLQDGARDDVQRVQVTGTVALFDACARAGVKRVIHISAIGADHQGPSAFARTKAAAEAHLKTLDLDWVILRPAVVLAPAVYGGTALLRGIAAFPGCVPLIAAEARLQVVSIDDVAQTVERAVLSDAPSKVIWDVAHPQVHTLTDVVKAIRAWLGYAPRRVVRLPNVAGKIVAAVADSIGWLGWRSPARTTSLAQLAAGVVGDPNGWMAATGIKPQSLEQILAAQPANVQDRWFARLYLIKPLAIAGLAATAIGTGAAEFVSLWRVAADTSGVSPAIFGRFALPGLVYGAVAVLAGLALLVRMMARAGLVGLLVLTSVNAADYSLKTWYSGDAPMAAIAALPILLTALFILAILDER